MRGPAGRVCDSKDVGEAKKSAARGAAGLVAPFSLKSLGERSYRNRPFLRGMARAEGGASKAAGSAEKEIASLQRQLRAMERRLAEQEERLREVAKRTDLASRREAVLFDALQLGEAAKRGDRGVIRELQDSVVRLEDYLLKTADRIEKILTALKQHRELLVTVNKKLLDVGTKDRIRLELDVMKNTLSILSLNGVDYDASLLKDIDALREKLSKSADLPQLERSKADLDKKFDGELKKFDLDAIWAKKKEIPGYR